MDWTLDVAERLYTASDLPGGDATINVNSLPFKTKNHHSAPHRPAKIKTTKINWEVLRHRYVMGVLPPDLENPKAREWPSLADVAREFGVSLGRVEVVSAAGCWPDQRESFRHRL